MKILYTLQKALHAGFDALLETIAPKDPVIRSLEQGDDLESFDRLVSRPRASLGGIICLYSYKDPLAKKAILEVKSYGNRKIAGLLGRALHKALMKELSGREAFRHFAKPLLVPIPMTAESVRKRGWNQCILITDACKTFDAENVFELALWALSKIRMTEDQVGKGRIERFKNLSGSFHAHESVRGRNVIVFDDISTTGATFAEAKRALYVAGAKSVTCIALAH